MLKWEETCILVSSRLAPIWRQLFDLPHPLDFFTFLRGWILFAPLVGRNLISYKKGLEVWYKGGSY